jgi:hypothetical protein
MAAISLIGGRLRGLEGFGRQKLVTQKVRLRVINGEESLSHVRLFVFVRKWKGSQPAADYGIEIS